MSDKVAVSVYSAASALLEALERCTGRPSTGRPTPIDIVIAAFAQREAAADAAGYARAIEDARVILDDYAGHWKECPAPTGCDCGYTNEVRKFREARDRALAAKPPRGTGGQP